jgi:hypothetical protein
MSSDAKVIIGLSAFIFATLYLTALACLSLVTEGETRGWILTFLAYPLFLLWPPSDSGISIPYQIYIWVCGTLLYICAGALLGLAIFAIRTFLKKLNA